ncbi:MAG: hypothetical protein A6F71_07865 [Cycloclasticus sp. symbiont of Poecilosclerida sp. M]|nr:MAG: hypothetical protein A6F71_07865 [Cycloclasticus sp. symbiont of Poecilosclerida sp. M]
MNNKVISKKEKTRERILDKAAQVFSTKGYQSTSLTEIATTAGMKAGSLYYHFASKEVLMTEVLERNVDTISDLVFDEIERLGENYLFKDGLEAFIKGHLTAVLKYPEYTKSTIRNDGQIPNAVQKAAHAKRDHYEEQWRRLMTLGKDEGVIRPEIDEKLLRLMILGCLNWSCVWYSSGGDDIDTLADQYLNVFLNGCS